LPGGWRDRRVRPIYASAGVAIPRWRWLWWAVRVLVLLLAVAAAACQGRAGVLCDDGRICPEDTRCELASNECIGGDQLVACRDLADGDPCRIANQTIGLCAGGICRFPRCGDGVRNGVEACDGSDLGPLACGTYGYYGGTVACNATCDGVDTRGCSGGCGDGVRNGAEVCDGDQLGGLSCQSFGWHDGDLRCQPGCATVDKDLCDGYCGDGIVNGTEICDGGQHAGESCTSLGAVGGAMGCNAYCQPTTDLCQWGRWRSIPVPEDDYLTGAWSSGPDDVWVLDTRGVRHFDGVRWQRSDIGDGSGGLNGIGGSGPDDVWVVTYDGDILHFDGTGWTETELGPLVQLDAVWSAGPDEAWAVGTRIARYDGRTWQTIEAPGVGWSRSLVSVWGSRPDDVWAVGGHGLVLHYDGTSWREIDLGTTYMLKAVRGTAGGDLWIVGDGVALRRRGGVWQEMEGSAAGYEDVWPTDDGTTWLVNVDGVHRHDGDGWHEIAAPTSQPLYSLWRNENGDVWAAGAWGALVHLAGRGWFAEPAGPGPTAAGDRMYTSASGAPWAISGSGGSGNNEVWRHVDHRWEQVRGPSRDYVAGLWALDADNAIIVGYFGGIHRYGDGVWTREDSGTNTFLLDVWGTGTDDVWAVGDDGLILHRDRDGWRSVPSPTTETISYVFGVAPDRVWAVATTKVLAYDGVAWRIEPFVETLSPRSVWASGPNDVWAVAGFGLVFRHDGAGWREVDIGAASNEATAVWGSGPNDVWIVGAHGSAYHWDGASWTPSATGTRAQLGAIGGTAAGDAWIVGERGLVLRRSDALPTAHGGACPAPAPISCGSRVVGAIVDAPATVGVTGCATAGGGQSYYRLANPVTGRITVEVEARGGDVDLAILGADALGGCDRAGACRAYTTTGGSQAVAELDGEQGQILYLVVSGPPGTAPSFTLDVDCDKRGAGGAID
jgi:hypothetical protein